MHAFMRPHVNKATKKSSQDGFTLIEVLVAIVILALGASGLAAMQLHTLRMAQQSGFQTSATQFAAELADIMRANPDQARSDSSPYLFSYQADAHATATSSMTVSMTACMLYACDSAAMATADVRDWQQRLERALPQARVTVCRDSSPAATTLRWHCDHARSAAIVIKIGWRPLTLLNQSVTSTATQIAAPPLTPGVAIAVDI